MDCDTELYRKNYKFFNSIDEYIKYDDLAEINGTNEISGLNYDFINSFNEHKFVDFKKLCNRFVYLVDALRKRNNGSTFNADYDFDYLNYWLNARIHEIDCEIRCKKSFFQNLRAETTGIHNWGNLSSEIYNIEENELNDINTLYNLHKNFSKLNKEIKESNPKEDEFMTYAKNCVKGYQELKDKCTGNEPKFCENLTNFKQKYEEINLCKYNFSKWRKEKLPSLTKDSDESLPDCETTVKEVDRETEQGYRGSPEPVESHSNMNVHSITIGVVTTLVISFIYFIFYKFTSFGSLIRSRIVKEGKKPGNLDVDMDHFSHTSEYGHFNSESKTYGIAYNS